MRIAMVCLGNICRSPMAEVVARQLLEDAGMADEVEVSSYGTSGYHVGEGADPGARAALQRRGWSAAGHQARHLRAADVEGADLVACADRANRRAVLELAGPAASSKVLLLRSFDPASSPDDEVPDPYAGGAVDFDRSLMLIERACRGLVAGLADRRR